MPPDEEIGKMLVREAVKTEDFGDMTRSLIERAQNCGIRGILSTLEGGYHLEALATSAEAHLAALIE